VREIRMLRTMWRELETESRHGLRHRRMAKAAGNSYSPDLKPPRLLSTLPTFSRDARAEAMRDGAPAIDLVLDHKESL
jgi:hypothetical protein